MSPYFWWVLASLPWSLVLIALWRAYGGPSEAEKERRLAERLTRDSHRLEALADLPEPMGQAVEKRKVHAAIGPHTASRYDRVVGR